MGTPMISTRTLGVANMYQLAALAAVSLIALWLRPEAVASILEGGLVMAVNLAAARFLATRALGSGSARMVYLLGLALKFVVLLGLVTVIMTQLQPDFLAFMLGLSTLFVGMAAAVLHGSLQARSTHPSQKLAR